MPLVVVLLLGVRSCLVLRGLRRPQGEDQGPLPERHSARGPREPARPAGPLQEQALLRPAKPEPERAPHLQRPRASRRGADAQPVWTIRQLRRALPRVRAAAAAARWAKTEVGQGYHDADGILFIRWLPYDFNAFCWGPLLTFVTTQHFDDHSRSPFPSFSCRIINLHVVGISTTRKCPFFCPGSCTPSPRKERQIIFPIHSPLVSP